MKTEIWNGKPIRFIELKDEWWAIKEFNDHCIHKDLKWIKHHILDPYHDEIDVKNGGFVRFSIGGSSKTWFEARKSVEWVHDNYLKLDWEAKL